MVQDEVLDHMYAARRDLTRLIVDLAPEGDEQREQLEALVARRDQLSAAIRAVIDAEFRAAQRPEMLDAVNLLKAETKSLNGLAKTLENVTKAVDITGKVIDLAVKVIAFAAGA